ncbi:hypothetical protein R1X32_10980 (plasmid) [Rhodococcus opacus]|uniref:hypothetical protein n=1 Tax=Rhodococcus opacus TaxID=37919 RepID=UPI0034D353FD
MSSNINRGGIVAGSRVIVHTHSEARNAEATFTGVVVEDFADEAGMAAEIGRRWAPVRRWAVALDDGRLVFADDDHLEAAD